MSMSAFGLMELAAELGEAAATIGAKTKAVQNETKEAVRDTMVDTVAVLTGELQGSIEITEDGVEATAPHAPFVEYGTYKDPPQPFADPALDAHEDEFVKGIEDAGDL